MFTNMQIALSIAIVLGTASARLPQLGRWSPRIRPGIRATRRSMSMTAVATMSALTLIPASAWNYCATSIPASNNPTNM